MAATTTNEGKLDACCLKEYRPLTGTPNGQIIKISGIDCYYIAGKDESYKGKAIVLLTDVFGKYIFLKFIQYVHVYAYRSGEKSSYYC